MDEYHTSTTHEGFMSIIYYHYALPVSSHTNNERAQIYNYASQNGVVVVEILDDGVVYKMKPH